jgi:predicted HicB family RNase H-like nuclease
MNDIKRSPGDYLKEPYSRVVIPDEESGTYTAQLLEFPGCIAEGDSVQEAYERLEKAALNWIEAALGLGQDVPPPASVCEYGGKVALRLPKSLHKQAVIAAERDGTSLNQFIVMAIAEKVGAARLYCHLIDRLDRRVFQIAGNDAVRILEAGTRIRKGASNLPTQRLPFITTSTAGVN